MSVIPEHFKLEFKPLAAREAVLSVGQARFTVLTDRLLRLEYHPEACFEDRASQAFWFRQQPVPQFAARTTENNGVGGIEIETEYLLLTYMDDGSGFTPDNLSILVKTTGAIWHPGDVDSENLFGTTRTLDFVNGYAPLQPGLMSRAGWSVLDDSTTLIFNDDCWLEPRTQGGLDLYFFGFGHDYKACLRDYCRVSGAIPMIPRWILGNWWSRYWAYTQDDLTALVNTFEKAELPFSVCIVDMDWHLTETDNDSTGWTGYTWNRKLFPDPKGFIDFAHSKGLKISLNLHPADGIHSHEEQYAEMARRTGIDPNSGQPVKFNITDPDFASAYFEVLHHPYEKMGVDFWWVDWQQGLKSNLPGLDPLWFINHLHFHDLGRDGQRRPFIFSRWGNEGHQRYPIGFSGDSYISWDTLNFQSYMTETATNIAYGWWSHDIGGHTSGTEDSELLTRWVQLGVFSPINRIHATKGLFYDRRPWMLENAETERVLRQTLQLRHALIPYLYTMARRAHDDSLPLIQPMYYDYPEAEAAYHCPHQYLFGTQLVAAPFVAPADPHTGLSRQVVWLPQGDWYHFFTGEHFVGDRWQPVYGALEDIPLFAKAGAIVPLAAHGSLFTSALQNPAEFDVHIFAGADGGFTLYEDDGETNAYRERHCSTVFTQKWGADGRRSELTIDATTGDTSLIPAARQFNVVVHGVREDVVIHTEISGQRAAISSTYDAKSETLRIMGIKIDTTHGEALRLIITTEADSLLSRRNRQRETILRLLKHFRLHTGVRNLIADKLEAILEAPEKITPYLLPMAESQARAFFEVLYDAGLHHVHDTHDPNLLIVWNNAEDGRISYRYSHIYLFFGSVWENDYQGGVVPRFGYFTPPVKNWRHGAQGEHVQRTQWQAQVDYCNLFTVIERHTEESP